MFTDFILNRFKNLQFAYNTNEEREGHLLSGEVKISIPDAIAAHDDYCKEHLPSQHQVGDKANVNFSGKHNPEIPELIAKVIAVHFFPGKVKYDLEVEVAIEESTRIYNIDSCFVLPVLKQPATSFPDWMIRK